MLERYFKLSAHGAYVRTGIIFVNPDILSASGMPKDLIFVATCLAAALGSLIMGLYANYPIALEPYMGSMPISFAVFNGMGFTWQAALGAVFISAPAVCLCWPVPGMRGHRQRHSAFAQIRNFSRDRAVF